MNETSSDRRHSASPDDKKIQTSLTACWKEGVVAQVMITIMDYYTIPFAVLLGATPAQVGILVAIPNLLSALGQLVSVRTLRLVGDRLKLLKIGLFLQALFLLPIGALSYLPWSHKLISLTALICVYKIITSLISPAWGSMVSEYLPPHRRGQYFGWRARICGLAAVLNVGFWGFFLYYWKRSISETSAFLMIFLGAGVARLISLYYMSQMANLPSPAKKEDDFTFWMFIRRFRESNYVKFIIYVSAITFATHMSAPFFSVYMLKELKFNYLNYMAVTLAALISSLVAFPLWGRHADVVGNARVLKTTSLLVPLIPILWIFAPNVQTLILIELFAGFVWGGFNLCAVNFIFDAVSPGKRVRCLSYFSLFNGVAIFAGSWLGGFLVGRLPPVFGSSLLSLFLLSGVGRMAAHFLLSGKFKEVRSETRPVRSLDLFFSVVGLRPLIGRAEDINSLTLKSDIHFGKRP